MNKIRLTRIDDEIMKEAAEIIRTELKDPRLLKIITVTRVKTSNDLKYCKIYVSVMGGEDEKANSLKILNNSAGYIRKKLAANINLRSTPEISFLADDSLDESYRILELLDSVAAAGERSVMRGSTGAE